MIDETNPAGRLHKLLSKAKQNDDKTIVRAVWSSTLEIEEDDIAVTKAVVELYALSQEIQELIKMNSSLNHELYLSSFRTIDSAFFPLNLRTTWNTVKPKLTEEALTRLQFCAQELSNYYSEESLSNEDLTDIIDKTENLFSSLYDSTLRDEIRLILLEEVQRIRNAISLYKIKGAKGLKEALQASIGAVIANGEMLKEATETNKDVMTRLGQLLDKADSFTAKALKIQKIIKHPIKFLIGLIPEDTEKQESATVNESET